MSEIINVLEIRKDIKEKHSEFMKNCGIQVSKAIADHALFAELALTKMKYLLNIFVEEKIVDLIEDISNNRPYKKLRLSMNGCDNYITIVTDGNNAVVEGFSYLTISGLQEPNRNIYIGLQEEGFNWDGFAIDILDKIHAVIYERREAVETKLKNALSGV
jgi:hypothetical protein